MFGNLPKEEALRFRSEGLFVPENVVSKVRVELTQGHIYRFLYSLFTPPTLKTTPTAIETTIITRITPLMKTTS